MQEQLTGTIDSIYTKMVNTKYGEKPVYHAMINGFDINLGFKNPYAEGETVTVTVENGKYGYELAKNPQAGATAITAPAQPTGPSVGPNRAPPAPDFPVAKNTKGITIARQNSGGHASRMVTALIHEGIIKNETEAMRVFFEFAYQITDFATGHREVKQAEAIANYEGK